MNEYRCLKCNSRCTLVHTQFYPGSLGSWRCPIHGPTKVARVKRGKKDKLDPVIDPESAAYGDV